MAIEHSITFGGVNSADYGIYIGGEGVFNAPERDAEMVSIPGRNGSFALDNGRFENIKVTYSAFNFEADFATFSANLEAFRNALCAQSGYQRLTDTFHTDEYRMAAFIGGLEIKPIEYNTASKFDIVFDCKPQRFLTSGEIAQAVVDGQTLTNPTLFPASPLIKCKGYGGISVGGDTITVQRIPVGDLLFANETPFSASDMQNSDLSEIIRIRIPTNKLNEDDPIYVSASNLTYNVNVNGYSFTSVSIENETGARWTTTYAITSPTKAYFRTTIPKQTFRKGSSVTKTYQYRLYWRADDGGGYIETSIPVAIRISYNGSATIIISATEIQSDAIETYSIAGKVGQINAYSSVIIDKSIYIDLDIGEAYFDDTSHTSANFGVSIPADLPTLRPGNNSIAIDNTLTEVEITPRWWKV